MRRFLVPSVLTIGMSVLAITLIVGVVARSPYTHGNLASAAGYTRTKVAYLGEEYMFPGNPLASPDAAQTSDAVNDGRLLFFNYGCAGCHHLDASGGAVGKDLRGDSALKITTKVRDGPKTMPPFSTSSLSDADLDKLIAFIQSLK
jgi:mono/diheme cytochrome c family protein